MMISRPSELLDEICDALRLDLSEHAVRRIVLDISIDAVPTAYVQLLMPTEAAEPLVTALKNNDSKVEVLDENETLIVDEKGMVWRK